MNEERGRPNSSRKWKTPPRRFALRISEELYKKVEDDHWKHRKSMNDVINDILREHYRCD